MFLDTGTVHVLGRESTLTLADVRLGPPIKEDTIGSARLRQMKGTSRAPTF